MGKKITPEYNSMKETISYTHGILCGLLLNPNIQTSDFLSHQIAYLIASIETRHPDLVSDNIKKKQRCLTRIVEKYLECIKPPSPPTDEQIRKDNPHFGPVIRVVDPIKKYEGDFLEFSHTITMGAKESDLNYGLSGNPQMADCWASYHWHKEKKKWVLGAN